MKTFRRILALALVLSLVLCLSMAAFATDPEPEEPAEPAPTTYTITLTPNPDDNGTHSYEAYQIFSGDLSEKNGRPALINIEWGTGVDGDALLAELQNANFGTAEEPRLPFAACNDAAQVADVLEGWADSSDDAYAFADIVAKHLASTSGTYANGAISGLEPGYYFVKDQDGSLNGQEDAAYTRYILYVLEDETVEVKSEVPSIDKKIDEDGGVSANEASIGDSIPFVITSNVPNMEGYNKYFFIINDTMSEGLTFNNDVAITIGDKELVEGEDFYVESSVDVSTGETSIKIVLKDFIQYADQEGDPIEISYSATLNENADLTSAGNVNTAKLTYSNDPNYEYTGDPGNPENPEEPPKPDEPTPPTPPDPENPEEPGEPGEPVGETPEINTKTFTTGIELIKVDPEGNTLTGAKFKIEGEKVVVVVINETVFEEDANGTWYLLKDGTYTETAPTAETAELYDEEGKTYAKVEHVVEDTHTEPVVAYGYVDANGHLKFDGLGEGTYTITEMVAPDGYNLLTVPITVVIDAELDQDGKTCTWSATVDGADATFSNNRIQVEVENKEGTTLPSTGGVGTTLFYVLGALMVLTAGVVLVVRKRVTE